MRVSVLVTAYNYARFIPSALDSVFAQDFSGEVECVVVDDGSTDDTWPLLRAYGRRILAVRQANAGQAAALNAAYAASSGDVLCLLDADDALEPNKVAEVVAAFRRSPEVGLVHHALRVVTEAGAGPEPDLMGATADGDVSGLMRRTALEWMFAPTSGLSLGRAVARHVFPLRTNLKSSADELVAPVAALLAPVRYLPAVLGMYRVHGSNVWASQAARPTGTLQEQRRRANWDRLLMEEKVAQANDVLWRSGAGGRLSPWIKWNYVKSCARVDGRSPLSYLPQVLSALAGAPGFRLGERIGLGAKLVRRAAKAHFGDKGRPDGT